MNDVTIVHDNDYIYFLKLARKYLS